MFVALWSNVLEKERRKKTDLYHFSCFSVGWSIQGLTNLSYIYSIESRCVIAVFQRHVLDLYLY